jgi:hypothetical protein
MKADDESHLTGGPRCPDFAGLEPFPFRLNRNGAALIASCAHSAQARGGHGFGRGGHGMHRAQFTGGRRHGNDAYAKAASGERDRLLTNRIKSICRGWLGTL